jgi:hypothetical protein
MSTQYRLVQSGKTASGGCSAASEPEAPRILFIYFLLLICYYHLCLGLPNGSNKVKPRPLRHQEHVKFDLLGFNTEWVAGRYQYTASISTLKMETVCLTEMLVSTCKSTRRCKIGDKHRHFQCCDNISQQLVRLRLKARALGPDRICGWGPPSGTKSSFPRSKTEGA